MGQVGDAKCITYMYVYEFRSCVTIVLLIVLCSFYITGV